MNGPLVPLVVLQRFVYSVLSASADVTTALGGANRIYPNFSPASVSTRHLVHEDYGGASVAKPARAPIGPVTMRWAVTAWEPGPSQQALEPLMQAVMGLLIGADTRGKMHRYVDGARTWAIYADYAGPDKVPIDVAPAGIWAPVREIYQLTLQQVA